MHPTKRIKFELTILGCGSATPTLRHLPTAQLVNYNEQYFLFDCGEGTQLQLRRFQLKFQRISHIFITHLHGDHCLGLPGLLSTLHLLGRTREMHIYAHPDLQSAVELQLKVSQSRLRYPLVWHELGYAAESVILETKALKVSSFPLKHGVPTCGFKIEELPRPLNIRPEAIAKYGIAPARIRQIKAGGNLTLSDGQIVDNSELTFQAAPPRAYAFCTDTAYVPATSGFVKGVDLLYHESTFLEDDSKRALATMHSTARQAAQVALDAGAKTLILGHYSARYRSDEAFKKEASEIFPHVVTANEGLIIPIGQ